ncbi:MAG: MgtC/SapB family protein [Spirochaetes bacterium]|nr:MAG: MgtC/SapB family protein [Spirochaetota bacterium]
MIDALTGLPLDHPVTVMVRLLVAMLAGFMVGYEREQHFQPAGLRTHMVLALGSCMIMLTSIYIPLDFMKMSPGSDPGRLAAQVISGIGFLGAGAIFRFGFTVRGLTTAASIWTISGVGLAIGAGFYFLGMLSTVLLVVILQFFDRIEDRFFAHKDMRVLTVVINSRLLSPKQVIEQVKRFDISIRSTSVTEDVEAGTTEIVLNCRIDEDFSIRLLFEAIKALDHIKTLRIE